MRSLFLLALFACVISACSTGRKFTTRKYTSGRYISHAAHKDRIDKQSSDKEQIILTSVENKKSSGDLVVKAPENTSVQQSIPEIRSSEKKNTEIKLIRLIEKNNLIFEKSKVVQAIQKKVARNENQRSKPASAPPAAKSLLSVILGGLGLVFDVVGGILTIVFAEYAFLGLCAIGFALGVVALIMGIMGMKQYREDKRNGEKNKTTLILGIIGTSLGGAAIFLALYLTFLSILIVPAVGN